MYKLWREARAEHHMDDGNGKFKRDAIIKPLALKASTELEESWRQQVYLVHEHYNADKTPADHMVSMHGPES
jgi:hypothetical protein